MISLLPQSRWFSIVATAALLASCHGQLRKAESLVASGDLVQAERLLIDDLQRHPSDTETRLLLGRVYLLEMRADDAKAVLAPLVTVAKFVPRVAQAYHEAAQKVPTDTPELIASYASAAAQLDPGLKSEACHMVTSHLDMRSPYLQKTAAAAAGIDDSCKRETLKMMLSWVQKVDPLGESLENLGRVGEVATSVDPESSIDFARAIRDIAATAATTDHRRAAQLVDVAKRVNAGVASELETVVLVSTVTDSPQYEQRGSTTSEILNRYAGTPLEVTKRLLLELGAAVEAYASEHTIYPRGEGITGITYLLRPYLRAPDVPVADGWGGQFQYVWTYNGARLISGGADGHVEAESRVVGGPRRGAVDDYGADIIWESGHIVQEPTESALHKYDRK